MSVPASTRGDSLRPSPPRRTSIANSAVAEEQTTPRHIQIGRPANACLRCRRRKVKCPCDQPTCLPCAKANAACEYPAKKGPVPNWQYVERLEARLRVQNEDGGAGQISESIASTSPVASIEHPPMRHATPSPAAHPAGRPSTLVPAESQRASVERIRLAPPSSAQLFDRLPSVADLDAIRLDAHVEAEQEESAPVNIDASLLPAREELDQAVEYFVTHVNTAFPILYEPSLRQQAERICGGAPLSGVDAFTAFTLMAIWCASRARGRSPRTDWFRRSQSNGESAKECFQPSTLRPCLVKLQCQHLWLHADADIWALTGDLIRAVFDLGLHLDSEGTGKQIHKPLELDMRRRIFWATYCLDQKVAVALGRPPGIVSDWISARFPSLEPDDAIGRSDTLPPCHRKESVYHHIRLRILQADIYQRLFTITASRSPPPPPEWIALMGHKLDEWRTSYHSQPGELLEPSWLDLHYNLSRQLLYRPNPGNPHPDQQSLRRALEASSYLMRRYKTMWRQRSINFVWLAIHHVFVSGVTYLNAIWIAAKNGWNVVPSVVEAMLDLQACSQVLEGMTETQHGTSHMRDAFEVVSAAVIRHLFTAPTHSPMVASVPSTSMAGSSSAQPAPSAPAPEQTHFDQLFQPPDLQSTTANAPWSSWAMDPSRPPSPVGAISDESLAGLDAFFFNPFGSVQTTDFMSLFPGAGEQVGTQMPF